MRTASRAIVSLTASMCTLAFAATASAQKATLAIRGFEATPAAERAAQAAGSSNALAQIIEGAEGQMENALQQTQKFQIVARGNLKTILKEQDLAESGLVNRLDPNTAKSLNLAGAKYVAVLVVDGFQDITDRTTFEDQLGQTRAERRMIQLSGVVKVFDTTSGTMLTSTALKIDQNQLDKIIPGVERTGRKTDAILAKVASELGSETALSITGAVYPAKVLAYTLGNITFNRSKATGVVPGQIWEVMHSGDELVDPDTGESLGREEISIGWARVTDADERFSKAVALVDRGIEKGSIMRLRPNGLPDGIDPNGRASGSATGSGSANGATSVGTPSRGGDVSGSRDASGAASTQAERSPLRLAVFVKNLADNVPANSTGILENDLIACFSGAGVSMISRGDVMNGVARFAGESDNTGGANPESIDVERALSDQASALRLAELLNADGFVVASISKYTTSTRNFNDPELDVRSSIREFDLGVAMRVVNGRTGATAYGDMVDARSALRSNDNLQQTEDPLGDLLQQAARKICAQSSSAMRAMRGPTGGQAGETSVAIQLTASGLVVPNITEDDNGNFVVGSSTLPLSLEGARVYVDGVLAGTAPGQFSMRPGTHRLRIEHGLFTPIEQIVNVREGSAVQNLDFAMVLSDKGRADWAKNIAIVEALKNGEVLRESQLELVRAFAEFLRQSSVTIDTSQVRNLNIGGRSIWAQILGE